MDSKYKYTYEWTVDYCYKGTDVLINKLNITNDEDLYNAERELVSFRISAFNDKPLKGNFDFKYLKDIHKYLFQDIYSWAGDIRNCNIAKQDLFCLTEHIESFGNDVFNKLKGEKYFVDYDSETTLCKLVELFADINALHPFRDENESLLKNKLRFSIWIIGIIHDLSYNLFIKKIIQEVKKCKRYK